MIDPNRLKRDHVMNVSMKKDKFFVEMTDNKDTWEISWEQFIEELKEKLEILIDKEG